MKLIEENDREYFYDFGVEKSFWKSIVKSKKKKRKKMKGFKIKDYCFIEDIIGKVCSFW